MMTALPGTAEITLFDLTPCCWTSLRIVSATKRPSTTMLLCTAPGGKGKTPAWSKRYPPLSTAASTILTELEPMSNATQPSLCPMELRKPRFNLLERPAIVITQKLFAFDETSTRGLKESFSSSPFDRVFLSQCGL